MKIIKWIKSLHWEFLMGFVLGGLTAKLSDWCSWWQFADHFGAGVIVFLLFSLSWSLHELDV
jgi:hypothetical protein